MNALKGKLMPQRDHTWLVQSIAFFRELHFFQQFAHLSNEALASELLRKWQEMFDTPLDLSRPYTDLDIVMWDTERVWWEDLEADVCAGNDIYIESLERWGKFHAAAYSRFILEKGGQVLPALFVSISSIRGNILLFIQRTWMIISISTYYPQSIEQCNRAVSSW